MFGQAKVGNGRKHLDAKRYFKEGGDDYFASEVCTLVGDIHRWSEHGLHQHGKQAFARFLTFIGYEDAPADKILAHDFPFSPPKDLSLAFASAKSDGIDEMASALQQAVNDTVDHVLEHQRRNGLVKMRLKHGGREHLYDADGLVVARIWHMLNREGEAQLHPHQLFANRVKLAGRELEGAFRAELLMKDRVRSDRIAQLFLAKRLRELGFGVQLTKIGGSLTFTIDGIDREVVEANSTRRRQIREAAERAGFDPDNLTYEQRELCHLKTRKWKDKIAEKDQLDILIANVDSLHIADILAARQPPDPDALCQAFARFERAGYIAMDQGKALLAPRDVAAARNLTGDTGKDKARAQLFAQKGIRLDEVPNILDVAVEMELRRAEDLDGVWNRRRIKDRVIKLCFQANICADVDEVEAAYDNAATKMDLHRFAGQFFEGGREEADEVLVTSRALLDAECSLVDICQRGRYSFSAPLMERTAAEEVLARWNAKNTAKNGWSLKEEQAAMVRACLAQRDRVVCIQGRAGTGKTTALRVVRDIVRQFHNDKIMGCATAGVAAENLGAGTLMPVTTIAGLLAHHRSPQGLPPDIRERIADGVIVVDEAGMTGSKDMAALLELADRYNSRVILVGDTAQLAPVAAGRPFFEIIDRGLAKVVELVEMTRHKDPIQAEAAVHLLEKNAALGLKLLHAHGQAQRGVGNAIVFDAVDGPGHNVVADVLANTTITDHKDIPKLTDRIRAALRDAGVITGQDVAIGPLVLAVGEHIRFTSAYRRWGIEPETSARITALNGSGATLAIKGREPLTIDLKNLKNINYNYCRTRRHDVVHVVPDATERTRRGVALAMEMTRTGRDVCLVTATNADRRELNKAMRQIWRDDNRLGKDHVFDGFTDHQGGDEPRTFSRGDRVICTAKHKGGVKNGDRGTIKRIDGSLVTIALDKGCEVILDLTVFKELDHAYAVTSYKSQGATHDGVVYLAPSYSPVLSSNEAYVAMTRQKYEAHILTDDVDALAERISREQATVSVLSKQEHGLLMEYGHELIPEIRAHIDAFMRREAQHMDELFRLRSEKRLTAVESRRISKAIATARKTMLDQVRTAMSELPVGVRQEMDRHLRDWNKKRMNSIVQSRKEFKSLKSLRLTEIEHRKEAKRIHGNMSRRHAGYDRTLREMLVVRYDPEFRERDHARRMADIQKREKAQLGSRASAPEPVAHEDIDSPETPGAGRKPSKAPTSAMVEPAKGLYAKKMDACRRAEKGTDERYNDKRAQAGLTLRRKLEALGIPKHQVELVADAVEAWDECRVAIRNQGLDDSPRRRAMEASRTEYLEACTTALATPASRIESGDERAKAKEPSSHSPRKKTAESPQGFRRGVRGRVLDTFAMPETRRRLRTLLGLKPDAPETVAEDQAQDAAMKDPTQVPVNIMADDSYLKKLTPLKDLKHGESLDGLLYHHPGHGLVVEAGDGTLYDVSMYDAYLRDLVGQVVEFSGGDRIQYLPLGLPLSEAHRGIVGYAHSDCPIMETNDGMQYYLPRDAWAKVKGRHIALEEEIRVLSEMEYERLAGRLVGGKSDMELQ